jgi:hypothetical protein
MMDVSIKFRVRSIVGVYASFLDVKKRGLDIECGNSIVADELRKRFGFSVFWADIASTVVPQL